MSVRWKMVVVAAVLALAGIATAVLLKHRLITLEGAVIAQNADPSKQSPIAGVVVSASDSLGVAGSTSDFSGLFRVTLRRTVLLGQPVTLSFRHPDYQPLDLQLPVDQLCIARMLPVHAETRPQLTQPEVVLSSLVVRYSVEARTATNIGGGAKAFEVVNTGDTPCAGHPPCSPDGKWKARIGGVSLDAGAENQFRDARLSCVAGPCPFTRIESDGYSKGGRYINATVRNWSDTTTFVLEAEVFRPQITNTVQRAYPIVLGRALHFTLPNSAEGPSIEAELDGSQIVFPLGQDASLSWATCEVRIEKDQTKVYRCELKPGYTFKDSKNSDSD
jgi:hypothetical protein